MCQLFGQTNRTYLDICRSQRNEYCQNQECTYRKGTKELCQRQDDCQTIIADCPAQQGENTQRSNLHYHFDDGQQYLVDGFYPFQNLTASIYFRQIADCQTCQQCKYNDLNGIALRNRSYNVVREEIGDNFRQGLIGTRDIGCQISGKLDAGTRLDNVGTNNTNRTGNDGGAGKTDKCLTAQCTDFLPLQRAYCFNDRAHNQYDNRHLDQAEENVTDKLYRYHDIGDNDTCYHAKDHGKEDQERIVLQQLIHILHPFFRCV